MGSKFARSACGTKRRVRAAAPWDRAGIERPPVAARLPAPANPFNTVLRSIRLSRSRVMSAIALASFADHSPRVRRQSLKRARQIDGYWSLVPCKWYASEVSFRYQYLSETRHFEYKYTARSSLRAV